MRVKGDPPQATCCVCLKTKNCVQIYYDLSGGSIAKDQFQYSEEHRGWLCKQCVKRLEEFKPDDERSIV